MPDAFWITPGYPWLREPVGGIFFRTQALALARLGLDLEIVSPVPWAPWPLSRLSSRWALYAQAPRRAVDEGLRVIRPRYPNVPGRPRWALPDRAVADAVWRARREWRGARLVHGHYSIHGMATWRVARRARIPFVITFHGDDLNTWPDQNPRRIGDLRAAMRAAGAVVTVSGPLADRVRAISGVEALHLPIGSDHAALAARALPRSEARARLGISPDRFVVLYVGLHIPAKGVRSLAEAILELPPSIHAVFVGGGPDQGYLAGDPAAGGRLDYRGERPHDDVVRYMSAADVLVLPSHGEGLPSVLVEAGSLGLPVIASRVGGIPQLLADGRGRLLPEVSPQAIAAAIRETQADPDGARTAATLLARFVREEYDVDLNAARLLERYRAIAPGL